MPIIEAFYGNDSIIPVADAKLDKAYQSRWDGKVFATREEYSKYILNRRHEVHQRVVHQRSAARLEHMRKTTTSFDDLIEWVADNQEWIGIKLQDRTRNKRYDPRKFGVEITALSAQKRICVSNTHSAPIGEVRNWHCDPALPGGYPGWRGSIELVLSNNYGIGGSDVAEMLGMYSGSGGSGDGLRYGYECIFWEQDWPGLEQSAFLNKLADKPEDYYYKKA